MIKDKKTIGDVLAYVQQNLKVPKGQKNSFGGYKYRSCEDIMEAVKKVLPEGYSIVASDDMIMLDDRFYIKATVSLMGFGEAISVNGFAREAYNRKGMDDSQITGTASSYARKYAANGLFAIDDTKDADTDSFTKRTRGSEIVKKPSKSKGVNPVLGAKELFTELKGCKDNDDLDQFRINYGKLSKTFDEKDEIMTEFKRLKTKFKE